MSESDVCVCVRVCGWVGDVSAMGECVISIMCKICVYILRKHLTLTTCVAYRIFVVVVVCVCVCVCVYV